MPATPLPSRPAVASRRLTRLDGPANLAEAVRARQRSRAPTRSRRPARRWPFCFKTPGTTRRSRRHPGPPGKMRSFDEATLQPGDLSSLLARLPTCLEIRRTRRDVTIHREGELVAVVTNGTAVLGLGTSALAGSLAWREREPLQAFATSPASTSRSGRRTRGCIRLPAPRADRRWNNLEDIRAPTVSI